MLTTFAGLTIAVGIIVQFTKPIIKRRFSDLGVRIYVFIISFILTMLFANSGFTAQGIVLTLINSILVVCQRWEDTRSCQIQWHKRKNNY